MEVIVTTESSEIGFYRADTFLIRFKSDKLVGIQEAKIMNDKLMSLANGKSFYFIVDALNVQSNMTTEAQKYFSKESEIAHYNLGMGILLNNLPIRLTASVFMKFHKPIYPTKIFSNYADALRWIDSLIAKSPN